LASDSRDDFEGGALHCFCPRAPKTLVTPLAVGVADIIICGKFFGDRLKRSYNWNKTMQNKSKTNPKQNKIVLFWVCFSGSYMWNKTLKQNRS